MDLDLIAHGIILGFGMVAFVFTLSFELRERSGASEAQRGPRP